MVMGSRAFAAAYYIMLPPGHPTCMGVFPMEEEKKSSAILTTIPVHLSNPFPLPPPPSPQAALLFSPPHFVVRGGRGRE